jgi:hypothetical protein
MAAQEEGKLEEATAVEQAVGKAAGTAVRDHQHTWTHELRPHCQTRLVNTQQLEQSRALPLVGHRSSSDQLAYPA